MPTRPRDLSVLASAMDVNDVSATQLHVRPRNDNTQDLGELTLRWANVYGVRFSGVSTTAEYADLAERYEADADYPAGTVLVIGGSHEVTTTTEPGDYKVAGIVSTNPAIMMNDNNQVGNWPFVALAGRVPCRVVGKIKKGDRIGSSETPGVAISLENGLARQGNIIGLAMEDYNSETEGMIEVMVKSG